MLVSAPSAQSRSLVSYADSRSISSCEDDLSAHHDRRLLLKGALTAMPTVAQAAGSPAGAGAAAPYVNPLVRNRADPHIHRHTDRRYYFTARSPEYDRIILRRSRTLRGIATADEAVIGRKHATGVMGAHIWAPEIHHIDGRWYIYFASAPAEDIRAIRIRVPENSHPDPFKGTWVERGQLKTAWETFSPDATAYSAAIITYTCGGGTNQQWTRGT